jgi:hypothetical protein
MLPGLTGRDQSLELNAMLHKHAIQMSELCDTTPQALPQVEKSDFVKSWRVHKQLGWPSAAGVNMTYWIGATAAMA